MRLLALGIGTVMDILYADNVIAVIAVLMFSGLSDLVLFLVSGVTLFHWLNDILLILGSLVLITTIVIRGEK